MEVDGYNWGYQLSNQVGIRIREGNNKVVVWCDEEDWTIEGIEGSGKVYDTLSDEGKVAFALGEALYLMLGGYK